MLVGIPFDDFDCDYFASLFLPAFDDFGETASDLG